MQQTDSGIDLMRVVAIMQERDAAQQRVAALEAALEPFARWCDMVDDADEDNEILLVFDDEERTDMEMLTVGHLRRAKAALKL